MTSLRRYKILKTESIQDITNRTEYLLMKLLRVLNLICKKN